MTTAYVQSAGRMAYLCGWPLVNVANRAAVFANALETGLLGDGVRSLQRSLRRTSG